MNRHWIGQDADAAVHRNNTRPFAAVEPFLFDSFFSFFLFRFICDSPVERFMAGNRFLFSFLAEFWQTGVCTVRMPRCEANG